MTYIVVPSPTGSISISFSDLVPVTDGTSPSPGQVGELASASQAALTVTGIGATGTYGSVVSLALTAGRWELQGVGRLAENTAVLENFVRLGISASATGVGIGDFEYIQSAPFLTGQPIQLLTPVVRVSIAVNTTFYLNSYFNYGSGTPQHAGTLWAFRYS
jgi:hypothetical protein